MGVLLQLLCFVFNSVQAVAESSIPSPTPMDIVTSARFVYQKNPTFMGVGGCLANAKERHWLSGLAECAC